jgi:hypothetical protein
VDQILDHDANQLVKKNKLKKKKKKKMVENLSSHEF